MSSLFGSKSASITPQVYTGIQVSTSMQGQPIPLVYGMTRGTMNLVWYGDFTATGTGNSSAKGGGGSSQPSSYNYTTAFAAALCEGPITGFAQIWHDRSIVTLVNENLSYSLGGSAPAIWTVPPVSQQIPYDHIACVFTPAYNLGASAAMPNLAFEIKAILYNTGPPGPTYGGTFTANMVTSSQTITNCSPPGSLQIGSLLSDSAGAIPGGTTVTAIGTGSVTMSNFPSSNANGDVISFTVTGVSSGDADPAKIFVDYLTDTNHGAQYPGPIASLLGNDNYQGYVWSLGIGLSPIETTQRNASDFLTELMQITNSDIVDSAGTLKVIPYCDAPVSGNGFSYTPNLTPVYVFTDDLYQYSEGEDPVKCTRKPLTDTYNYVQVEYLDRTNFYNTAVAEAFDLNDINQNGVRMSSTYTFHAITNANTARTVAQLLLQTSLYERNTFKFKVLANYGLVEPMDYVSITDAGLGLNGQVARIITVSETGTNEVEIEALEITGTVRTAPQYNWSAAQGNAQNYNSSPGNVAAPLIFVPPPSLGSSVIGSTTQIQLCVAVCGQTINAYWNGCNVYVSTDGGNNYYYAGVVTQPARYGTLTATLPVGASNPDTTNTLSVVLTNTTQTMSTATVGDATSFQTMLLVDPNASLEVLAYETATQTSAGHYNLTYLPRGGYGTVNASHTSGVPWVRYDGAIFSINVDPGAIGNSVYFKFCSFNTFGQTTSDQDLANVTAYSYTPVSGALSPSVSVVTTGTAIAYNYLIAKATTGTNTWDSAVYSKMGYPACQVSARPQTLSANGLGMIGFSKNPSASSSYTNADFGLYASYFSGATRVEVWEAGTQIATYGTYAKGDLLSVTYDGANVRYFQNGVLLHTTPAVGLTLYLFVPMLWNGGVFSDVTFNQITAQQNNATWVTRGTNGVAVAGNQLQSQNNTSGWGVVDAYTRQSYGNGATFSCRFPINANGVMAGFTTALSGGTPYNPTTGGGGTSQFLWFANNSSGFPQQIAETIGGTTTLYNISASTVAATDVLSIEYDGFYVRYYYNGVLLRTSPPVPGLVLSGYFTSDVAGDIAADVYFASVPAATPWAWEQTGTCIVNDDNAVKPTGSAAWDSGAFTISGFTQAHIQGKASGAADVAMFGLTTTPSASVSFSNINYAWYNAGGTWEIYESGTLVGGSRGTVATTDLAWITYDGATITYWLNGASIRTVSIAALTVYGQVAMYNVNAAGGINSLKFGSGVKIDSTATAAIDQNAATTVGINVQTGFPIVIALGPGNRVRDFGVSVTPSPTQCEIIVTLTTPNAIQTSGTTGDLFIEIAFSDDGGTTWQYLDQAVTTTANSYMLQAQFTHDPAHGSFVQAWCAAYNSGGTSGGITFQSGAAIQIEAINR